MASRIITVFLFVLTAATFLFFLLEQKDMGEKAEKKIFVKASADGCRT